MRNKIVSVLGIFLLISCGGSGSKVTEKTGLSEKELIAGFEWVREEFNKIFENPKDYDQAGLKPLNDSLVYYVDALIADFPKSAELPEVLCNAGISSLNVKNSKKALEYLNYVVDSFPTHSIVPKSMYFIGRTKEVVLEDIEGAKEAYKKLARQYGTSVWGMNARTSVQLIMNPASIEQSVLGDDQDSSKE